MFSIYFFVGFVPNTEINPCIKKMLRHDTFTDTIDNTFLFSNTLIFVRFILVRLFLTFGE